MANTAPTFRRRSAWLGVLVVAAAFAACDGENLYTLGVDLATTGGGTRGPDVDIITPGPDTEVDLGQSLFVDVLATADTVTRAPLTTGVISSHYEGSDVEPYNEARVNLFNAAEVAFGRTLTVAAGQIAGSAYIVVTITDDQGDIGVDSVKVVIN